MVQDFFNKHASGQSDLRSYFPRNIDEIGDRPTPRLYRKFTHAELNNLLAGMATMCRLREYHYFTARQKGIDDVKRLQQEMTSFQETNQALLEEVEAAKEKDQEKNATILGLQKKVQDKDSIISSHERQILELRVNPSQHPPLVPDPHVGAEYRAQQNAYNNPYARPQVIDPDSFQRVLSPRLKTQTSDPQPPLAKAAVPIMQDFLTVVNQRLTLLDRQPQLQDDSKAKEVSVFQGNGVYKVQDFI